MKTTRPSRREYNLKHKRIQRKATSEYDKELKAKAKATTDHSVKGRRIKTKYLGVYLQYVTYSGKERWRSHIHYYPLETVNPNTGLPTPDEYGKLPKKKLQVLGTFNTPIEAAECRDQIIRAYNLPLKLNIPLAGEVETKIPRTFTKDTAEFLVRYGDHVDYTVLAGLVHETPRKVREFLKANGKQPIITKSDVVVFDIRENYEKLE